MEAISSTWISASAISYADFSWDIISHSSRELTSPLFRSATASLAKCGSDSGRLICSWFSVWQNRSCKETWPFTGLPLPFYVIFGHIFALCCHWASRPFSLRSAWVSMRCWWTASLDSTTTYLRPSGAVWATRFCCATPYFKRPATLQNPCSVPTKWQSHLKTRWLSRLEIFTFCGRSRFWSDQPTDTADRAST